MASNYDWAIKLAIERLCDKLPPDTVAQVNEVVQAGIGIKKQLDRIEFVQIELLKLLQLNISEMNKIFQIGRASNGFDNPRTRTSALIENDGGNGRRAIASDPEPPTSTGK